MIVHPRAKINLGLNIVSKRADGYHDLETVFYPVDITDTLQIEVRNDERWQGEPCELSVNGIDIDGKTSDNLVVKAYEMVRKHFPDIPHVRVNLKKNIPIQAGMGGGSSDCAYTVTTLNKMFNLGMSISDMQELTSKLGADCAFFVNPEPAFATGIGERLRPISLDLSAYHMAIIKPPIMISTREAFSRITPKRPAKSCLDVVSQPIETWREKLINDFEQGIMSIHPEIGKIKQTLYDMGAVYAAMSGSGSAVFGLFSNRPKDINTTFNDCFTQVI